MEKNIGIHGSEGRPSSGACTQGREVGPQPIPKRPGGSFYGLAEKYAMLEKGGPNPFIDSRGCQDHLDRKEREFNAKLEEQRAVKR